MALVNLNYVTQTRFSVSVPDIGLEQQVTKRSGLKMEHEVLKVSTGENFNVLHLIAYFMYKFRFIRDMADF